MLKKKVIAVIPARMGSTRFHGKPLYIINGKPLIEWVYLGVKNSKWVNKIVIATDDEKIQSVCKNFGAEVCLTSTKHKSGSDRVTEIISKKGYQNYQIVINIQGDQPLVNSKIIQQLLFPFVYQQQVREGKFLKQKVKKSLLNVKVSTLRKKITKDIENSNIVKVVTDNNSNALYFSRQKIPYWHDKKIKVNFYEHIGLYAYERKMLLNFHSLRQTSLEKLECLEQMRLLENDIKIYVGETKEYLTDVNTIEDIAKVKKNLVFFQE